MKNAKSSSKRNAKKTIQIPCLAFSFLYCVILLAYLSTSIPTSKINIWTVPRQYFLSKTHVNVTKHRFVNIWQSFRYVSHFTRVPVGVNCPAAWSHNSRTIVADESFRHITSVKNFPPHSRHTYTYTHIYTHRQIYTQITDQFGRKSAPPPQIIYSLASAIN